MSQCLWCDIGQHPYPAGQTGSTSITVREEVANQWGGQQPHNITQDVCAACAKDLMLSASALKRENTQEQRDAEAELIRERQGGVFRRALDNGKSKLRVKLTEPEDDL